MGFQLDWDEFRLVKAIADAHSLVGAADALGLNHSTVFRRLAAVEAALGSRLFERARSGYRPTAAGEEMVNHAGAMGDSVAEFERRVAGREIQPNGELRLTAVDTMAVSVLPPILARFREIQPGLRVDVVIAAHELNLARREADVALRLTDEPSETLVGRKICRLRWAAYCAPDLVSRFGADVVARAPWIGFGDSFGPVRGHRWLDKYVGERRLALRLNSALAMSECAATGIGATLLPCFMGDANAALVRAGEPQAELDVDLWLLSHPDLRHSPRVRAFTEFAGAELAKLRKRFEGERGAP